MGGLNLLLDTHVLLWMLAEPEKLSLPARTVLESTESVLLVSPVSLFEVSTKVRLGKLPHPGPLLRQMEWTLTRLKVEVLPLSGAAAVLAGELKEKHRDPFDRLLAAQAISSNLALVSCDPVFQHFQDLEVLW